MRNKRPQQEGAHSYRRRPEHVDQEQSTILAQLLASPPGSTLATIRQFLLDWYAMWQDEQGNKRSLTEAEQRYNTWRKDPRYAAVPALRRVMARMTAEHFVPLSQFLRNPDWEATNNGAERGGRTFRHGQRPHFNLRAGPSLKDALKVRMLHRMQGALPPPTEPVAHCSRGRHATAPVAASRPARYPQACPQCSSSAQCPPSWPRYSSAS